MSTLPLFPQTDFPRGLAAYRTQLWGLLGVLVLWAGVRFSDGTVLLAISKGLPPSDPSLVGFGQWLWDAPLKVGLLRLLPANVIAIGLVFAALGVLPAAGLVSKNPRIVWLTVVAVFLTPAFKVSIQNLGVGDGLIIALVMLISANADIRIVAAATLAMALWHPQQSFFIGVSFFVGRICYYGTLERPKMLAIACALAVGAVGFLAYKVALPFSFAGRGAFMAQHGQDTLLRNLYYSPIAFAPLVLWLSCLAPKPVHLRWLMFGWLLVLGVMALLTSDVTRVMTITSLPIVLAGADRIVGERSSPSAARVLTAAVLIALVPPLNWSGLDYFLWPDLIHDLCKWHLYCGIAGPGG